MLTYSVPLKESLAGDRDFCFYSLSLVILGGCNEVNVCLSSVSYLGRLYLESVNITGFGNGVRKLVSQPERFEFFFDWICYPYDCSVSSPTRHKLLYMQQSYY